jgi:hypothetical protein
MTINYKPGQHPDADQLSAFLSQALPAHEREGVLAHLAVCGECRGVVALAMPEEPAMQPAAPEQVPRGWFAGWMVLLPTAAAVAALAVFVFYTRHQSMAPQQEARITISSRAQAPAQVEQQPAAPAQVAPEVVPARPQASVAGNESLPVPKPREEAPRAAMGMVAGNAVTDRSLAQPVLQAAPAPAPTPSVSAFVSDAASVNGPVQGQLEPAQQRSMQQDKRRRATVGGPLQNNSVLPAQANAQNGQESNSYSRNQTETVAVDSAAPSLQVQDVAPRSSIIHQDIDDLAHRVGPSFITLIPTHLPSGRAILSTAEQGTMVLAIDTHHALFVSNDSGAHWQPVRAVWKGRAVKVEAVAATPSVSVPVTGSNVVSLDALSSGAMAAKTAGATLTGTVTDRTGAVIPGATITVTEPSTHLSRSITTDAQGRFTAAGLQPGEYNLDASARGFKTNHQTNLVLSAANENVENVTLDVGAVTEAVTVEADALSVQTTSANLSATIEGNEKKALKAAAALPAAPAPPPVFEIVTDKGIRWESADGLTWWQKQ